MAERLSLDEKRMICKLYEDGKSFYEIYKITGRSRTAQIKLLTKVGLYSKGLITKADIRAKYNFYKNTNYFGSKILSPTIYESLFMAELEQIKVEAKIEYNLLFESDKLINDYCKNDCDTLNELMEVN